MVIGLSERQPNGVIIIVIITCAVALHFVPITTSDKYIIIFCPFLKTRTSLDIVGLNTGGAEAADDANTIAVEFQAVLCDLPEVIAGN